MTTLDPAPKQLAAVLDPEWLTATLGDLAPGDTVVASSVVETLQTVATKVRFDTTVRSASGEETHRGYCVKGYFEADGPGGGAGEGTFYRELAPRLSINRPPCVYTGVNTETGHCLHIMNDLVVRGSRFLTALTPYAPEQVAASLGELARLHAETWDDAELAGAEWLAPRLANIPDRFPDDMLQGLVDDGRCDGMAPALRDAPRLSASMRAVGARDAADAHCVVHGDAHAGNVYVDPDGRPGIIDWQVVHFGHWALDVSYHVAAVLTVEDRRAHEQELLRGYLETLSRLGGKPPAWDEAWDEYRAHTAHGYYFWAITRFVDRPIIVEFMPRLGAAVEDLGAFDLLGV